MTLFRVDPEKSFHGPHQGQRVETYGASPSQANAAMILVHGRGATARSMFPLADELARPDFYYAAPQAKNHTWYPFSFLVEQEKNQPGISSGLQVVNDVLQSIRNDGIPEEKVMLLGFSQGACLAAEFAARHPRRFGGVVVLSGGLIGAQVDASSYRGSLEQTPVLLGCSDADPHIPKERVDATARIFERLDATVDKRIYAGMGHTINEDEIEAVRGMMRGMAGG